MRFPGVPMSVFKPKPTPTTNENETREVVAPLQGREVAHSRDTGTPLPPSSTDTPDHPPEIAWPVAGGPDDRKPFKSLK
jgi:hypothetical protein